MTWILYWASTDDSPNAPKEEEASYTRYLWWEGPAPLDPIAIEDIGNAHFEVWGHVKRQHFPCGAKVLTELPMQVKARLINEWSEKLAEARRMLTILESS